MDPVLFKDAQMIMLSSARVQNLSRNEDKAQGKNWLAHDHMAGWCQSRPTPGVQIPFLTTDCLKWVDFVWETVKTQRV